ncbi:RNA polymerase sigma factor RpoS [uncultured archaeon]|nr:RNA polymerase sigma factor RpoS [uncultured archaeon]
MSFLNGGTLEDADKYCAMVQTIPRLTKAQEIELGQRIQHNPEDTESRELLIKHNLKIPIYLSKRYVGCGIPFSDLIQEGNLGLIRAVNTYDPSKKVCFATYAYYSVKHRLFGAISRKSRLVRVSQKTRKMSSDIRKGKLPTKKALKTRLKYLKMSTIEELAHLSTYREVSLDKEVPTSHTGKPMLFVNMFPDPRSLEEFKQVDNKDFQDKRNEALDTLLKILKPRDREIIELLFGLNGKERLDFRQIGKLQGCTYQNIHSRYTKALVKLRGRRKRLIEYAPT